MQLMIDTNDTSAHKLITTALYLLSLAAVPEGNRMLKACREVQDGERSADDTPAPSVPSGTVPPPPPPAPPAPPVSVGTATAPAGSDAAPPSVPTIPPAPAAAPTTESATTATAAANATTGVDPTKPLDKRGYPWDARIHSAGANINKSDGLWRTKRGVDNSLIESVEAELRAQGYGVAVPPAPLSPAAAFVANPAITVQVPPPPPGAVPPPPASVIPPPPGAANSGQPASVQGGQDAGQVDQFRVLMNTIGGHTGPDGKCRREIMAPIYEKLLGRPGGLPDFHKARDKIPELLVEVRRILGA